MMTPDETERYRFQCEVRLILALRNKKGREWARKYFQEIARFRGKAAADLLFDTVRKQWELGNRGITGDWRE